MPHPFFDVRFFPWHLPLAQELFRTLPVVVAGPQVIGNLYHASHAGMAALNMVASAEVIWTEALDNLARQQKLRALFRLLLERREYAAIHVLIGRIETAPDITGFPILPRSGRIFLDRVGLRDKLRRLHGPLPPQSVLLVRGRPGSGMTWTLHLIAEFAKELSIAYTYLFSGNVNTVEELADHLFAFLGRPGHVVPRAESPVAWYRRICNTLLAFANDRARPDEPFWIVMDDLGTRDDIPLMPPELREFFDQFVLQMVNPAMSERFRLVLLDYPDVAVPTRWQEVWTEDRPDAAHVDIGCIRELLLFQAGKNDQQLEPEEVERLANDILTAAEKEAGKPRLRAINHELARRLAVG